MNEKYCARHNFVKDIMAAVKFKDTINCTVNEGKKVKTNMVEQ